MPKVTVGKQYSKQYTEDDVQKALQAIQNGMGKKTASNKFNIPRATLQFRLSNLFVKTRPGPDTVLSNPEETEIVKWIITASRKGFPRRKEDVIKSVKLFLDEHPRTNSFVDNTPGEGWYKLFLKRHPELSIRTSEAVSSASSKLSEKLIRNWFTQVEEYLKENDLFHILSDPSRVYNGDETNFILCPKNTKVIALKGTKNVYEIDHAQSKSCVTVMFTFSADGVITPPMIIYPLKRMRPEIQKSVPSEWGIGLSDSGWMKAELFIQYIQNVLHPALMTRNITFPVILFLDGHKTHTTFQLTQLCQSLGIILIAIYPNATRILQPADVAAFRPIKVMWRKAVLEWRTDNLTKSLLKTDVAPILEKLLPKLNKSTLKNGFEACGLCPFNPDQVDYTKCLMPCKPVQETLDDNCSTSLNYQTFEEIVGPQLIRKMKNQVVGQSIEAKKLHDLYKYLVPKFSTQESPSQIMETTSVDIMQHKDMTNLYEQDNGLKDFNTMTAFNELTTMPTEVQLLLNAPELSTHEPQSVDTGTSRINTIVVDYSETAEQKKPLPVDLHHLGVDKIPLAPCITNSPINNSVPKAVQNVEVVSECKKENQPVTSINLMTIPSTSRQSVEQVGGKWVLVDNLPTEVPSKTPIKKQNIKDFLNLPKNPIKKEKTGKEYRSFVLTSKDWEAVELEKRQKKIKEIQERENKRIERLEKSKEKSLLKEKKQAEKVNKKNKAKNLNLIKKSKTNSDNIKPKIVIQSNILIKSANKTCNIEEDDIVAVEAANDRSFEETEQVQMVKKELKEGPNLDKYFKDPKETGKDKKLNVKENRMKPMSNKELLKMLEDD